MRPRTLLTISGALLGLIVGTIAGIFVIGTSAGLLWLFVFGDNPWPSAAPAGLLAFGGATALGLMAAGGLVGGSYGKQVERTSPHLAAARARLALAVVVCASLLSIASFVYVARPRQGTPAEIGMKRVDRLVEQGQHFSSVEAGLTDDRSGWRLRVVTTGKQGGKYLLRISLLGSGRELLSRNHAVTLQPGENETIRVLTGDEVVAAFSGRVFARGAVNVSIDESDELRASLQPDLNQRELELIGKDEAQNLRLGASRLIEQRSVPIQIGFTVRADGGYTLAE